MPQLSTLAEELTSCVSVVSHSILEFICLMDWHMSNPLLHPMQHTTASHAPLPAGPGEVGHAFFLPLELMQGTTVAKHFFGGKRKKIYHYLSHSPAPLKDTKSNRDKAKQKK